MSNPDLSYIDKAMADAKKETVDKIMAAAIDLVLEARSLRYSDNYDKIWNRFRKKLNRIL